MKLIFEQKTLKTVNSSFSGPVSVVEAIGGRKIMAGGLLQSGGVINNIWKKGLEKIASLNLPVHEALILGLGGGTAAHLAAKKWPQAAITGVEIDGVMIELGREYFNLDGLANLELVQADAIKLVTGLRLPAASYDLVLIDLYQGEKVVEATANEKFLAGIKRILRRPGAAVFNRLYYDEHRETAEEFVKTVERTFPQVELVRVWSNLLVVVESA